MRGRLGSVSIRFLLISPPLFRPPSFSFSLSLSLSSFSLSLSTPAVPQASSLRQQPAPTKALVPIQELQNLRSLHPRCGLGQQRTRRRRSGGRGGEAGRKEQQRGRWRRKRQSVSHAGVRQVETANQQRCEGGGLEVQQWRGVEGGLGERCWGVTRWGAGEREARAVSSLTTDYSPELPLPLQFEGREREGGRKRERE